VRQNDGLYTRWEYPADGRSLKSFQNIRADLNENYSVEVYDGWGRTRRTASYMPGSTTRYSGRQFYYDNMGRLAQWTNPTETTGDPDWTAAGDDATPEGNGWVSTSRTYDWRGRPRVTTYPDNTTTELDYGGCGCAGGEVTTARDQRGRLKKVYHDVLGRLSKVEELDYNSTVYSTAVYEYNARDQITSIRHYQGTNRTYQERTFGYDGHGRLVTRYTPEQGTTSYSYYDDDTLHVLTDARGASQTFGYTARHLLNSIDFNSASGVAATPNVSFTYDGAGNRTQMTKAGQLTAAYHYDSLSRMDWESRTFNGLGTYYLYYGYNSVGLAWVNNHWGSSVDYTIDPTGAAASATGSGTWSTPNLRAGHAVPCLGRREVGHVRQRPHAVGDLRQDAAPRRVGRVGRDGLEIFLLGLRREHGARDLRAEHVRGQRRRGRGGRPDARPLLQL
jgi:YD repeat-containing protein